MNPINKPLMESYWRYRAKGYRPNWAWMLAMSSMLAQQQQQQQRTST